MLDMIAAKRMVHNRFKRSNSLSRLPSDYEVLIIGAGIAGIGMACRLQQQKDKGFFGHQSSKSRSRNLFKRSNNKQQTERFLVVEKRADLGGTWDLFTYPGIRSDSDALTFGYSFRPWLDYRMLAKGADIKRYIADTARGFGINEHIRYQHEVQQLSWCSDAQQWTATIKNHDSGKIFSLTAKFVVGATGYYDYEEGYRPTFKNEEGFQGDIIHPQHWQNLNYDNKKIVIIGSGATAMTLLPALVDETAEQCAQHVTMLQRSPTYVASVPGDDYTLDWLAGRFSPLSKAQAYTLLRTRNVLMQQGIYRASKYAPTVMRTLLKSGVKKALKGSGVAVSHFLPEYDPWDQRVCAVPDGDLFNVLQGTHAAVLTDKISHFTKTGIMLDSGNHLEADIIVTATGLKIQMLGGAKVYIDKQLIDIGSRMTYKAVMIEGVPNLAALFGYTNASWTLKIDLACQYVLRLLGYMHKHRYQVALPKAKTAQSEAHVQTDTVMGALTSGYVKRAQHELPKQGDIYPWRVTNNYLSDRIMLKHRKIKDQWLQFRR